MAEVVLILITVMIVFGAGKLPSIASRLGRLRSRARGAKASGVPPTVIDITPEREAVAPRGPKPGARRPGVEDAQVDPEPRV